MQRPQITDPLDHIWANVNQGVPSTAKQGIEAQRAQNANMNAALAANNYLPLGVSREGLIAQARARAPNQNMNIGLPGQSAQAVLPPGAGTGANSTMGQPTMVLNTGSGPQNMMGAAPAQTALPYPQPYDFSSIG